MDIRAAFPFPIIGIDSDNGSESINWHLLRWCEQNKTTFTRSRSGNSNDGAHVEQKNWAVVRTVVGYHRYDTSAELLLLNKIWALQSLMTNYFGPQQKLISKVRNGAKVSKKYDKPKIPHRFDPTRRGQHTYCVCFGDPINTDVEQRFGHRHPSSSQWQRRHDEEADYRAVTDWRSTAHPSVAGPQPRKNRGRRCHEGRRTATEPRRHPGSRRVPTTATSSMPVLRSVHQ